MNKKTIITILLALIMAPVGVEAKKKVKTVEVPQLVNYPSAEVSEYRLRIDLPLLVVVYHIHNNAFLTHFIVRER